MLPTGLTGFRRLRKNGWPQPSNSVKSRMATMQLPPEIRKFLSSLNRHAVDYLVIGGYAVIFHGYVRTTADIDIWVAVNPANASRVEAAIRDADFNPSWLKANARQDGSRLNSMD